MATNERTSRPASHEISENREVLQYVITCQNTYVICRQPLRQVLVLQHLALRFGLTWNPNTPGAA